MSFINFSQLINLFIILQLLFLRLHSRKYIFIHVVLHFCDHFSSIMYKLLFLITPKRGATGNKSFNNPPKCLPHVTGMSIVHCSST